MQGFITDHERALEELFCESAEGFNKYNACLNAMATRISTVFASMRVCMFIPLQVLPELGLLVQQQKSALSLLGSISTGLGVLIGLCLLSLHLQYCVIYICPLGLQ